MLVYDRGSSGAGGGSGAQRPDYRPVRPEPNYPDPNSYPEIVDYVDYKTFEAALGGNALLTCQVVGANNWR